MSVGREGSAGSRGPAPRGGGPAVRHLSVAHIETCSTPFVEIAAGGNYLRVRVPEAVEGESREGVEDLAPAAPGATGSKRGKISGFTRQSAARLRRVVNQFDQRNELPPDFVTLTYPAEFETARGSKQDLNRFGKALVRAFPAAVAVWKLEPQKRGAPHFHLIVVGAPGLTADWCARTWNAIAAPGDEKHLRVHLGQAGGNNRPCCERASTWSRVNDYISKYCVKLVDATAWHEPGRFWGKINSPMFSRYVHLERHDVSRAAAQKIERVGRKLRASKTRGRFLIRIESWDKDNPTTRDVRSWSFEKLRARYLEATYETHDQSFLSSIAGYVANYLPRSLSTAADRKQCRAVLTELSRDFVNARFSLVYGGSKRWTQSVQRQLPGGLVQDVRMIRPMRTLLIPANDGAKLVTWAQAAADDDALALVESSPASPSVREWMRVDEAHRRAWAPVERRKPLPANQRASVEQLAFT